jgi:hypothetical protein
MVGKGEKTAKNSGGKMRKKRDFASVGEVVKKVYRPRRRVAGMAKRVNDRGSRVAWKGKF